LSDWFDVAGVDAMLYDVGSSCRLVCGSKGTALCSNKGLGFLDLLVREVFPTFKEKFFYARFLGFSFARFGRLFFTSDNPQYRMVSPNL
jgi:hypothetical protein